MTQRMAYLGGPIFDGTRIWSGCALMMEAGRVMAVVPEGAAEGDRVDLHGDLLSPGFVDLQVNGGGGVMLGDAANQEGLARIAAAHRRLGVTTLLATLITDTPERTRAVIAAVADAGNLPGIGGVHLEGPHLALAKKGAHDAALIRPMQPSDLAELVAAAARLPVLMVTLAPEAVTLDQVRALTQAGVIVALGHTDADYETCRAYAAAGARVATHLFNAMSGLGHRAPGLVGTVLEGDAMSAGLIADGVHVHPAALRATLAARGAGIFLVSDAMAVAGTEAGAFDLGGRRILRRDGRLTLQDGTLAGADLDLGRAVAVVEAMGGDLARALAMATSVPARVARLPKGVGCFVPGAKAEPIRLRRGAQCYEVVPLG